jgi:hypothetical protein
MKKEELLNIWMRIRFIVALILLVIGVYLLIQPAEYCFSYSGIPPIHECGTKEYILEKYDGYLNPQKKIFDLFNNNS